MSFCTYVFKTLKCSRNFKEPGCTKEISITVLGYINTMIFFKRILFKYFMCIWLLPKWKLINSFQFNVIRIFFFFFLWNAYFDLSYFKQLNCIHIRTMHVHIFAQRDVHKQIHTHLHALLPYYGSFSFNWMICVCVLVSCYAFHFFNRSKADVIP